MIFFPYLNKMKKHTKSSGHYCIDELQISLTEYDEAFYENDVLRIIEIQRKNLRSLRRLTPHLTNRMLWVSNKIVSNELERLTKKLKSHNGGFKDIQNLLKLSAYIIKDEL